MMNLQCNLNKNMMIYISSIMLLHITTNHRRSLPRGSFKSTFIMQRVSNHKCPKKPPMKSQRNGPNSVTSISKTTSNKAMPRSNPSQSEPQKQSSVQPPPMLSSVYQRKSLPSTAELLPNYQSFHCSVLKIKLMKKKKSYSMTRMFLMTQHL